MRPRRRVLLAHAKFVVLAIGLGLTAASCASPERDGTVETKAVTIAAATAGAAPGDLDVLFMIDDSTGMTSMQTALAAQLPFFIDALESLPNGLPNIHIAVVSSDLGAPGDSTSVTCTTAGDQGLFQLSRGCTNSTLAAGQTYISNVDGVANYTGNLADVLACIMPLGDTGCGFGHQLGSIARALGADGAGPPARNDRFLRPGADLAIIILSSSDDCSAPPTTYLYSINNGQNNLTNAYGPLTRYRCNEFGHLCTDRSSDPPTSIQPPETAPLDAPGGPDAPTLNLFDCESLDTDGLLTPVSTLVSGLKALKGHPDSQIFVGAIVAPPAPYTVDWVAPVGGQNLRPGELWPQVEPSCSSNDGSSGEPAVRITQLVKAFGANGVSTSICDSSPTGYAGLLSGLASKIGDHLQRGGDAATTSGAGGSGAGGTGTTVGDAGAVGATGAGGKTAITGTGASAQIGAGGHGPSGLTHGGCDVGSSGTGASGLLLTALFLLGARRRRKPTVSSMSIWVAIVIGLAAASCAQPNVDPSAGASPAAVTAAATATGPGNLDVLFMIDNSSSMTVTQRKLAAQIPGFLTALQNLPMGLPNIHIAVISSDMGAPGDVTSSIQCTQSGDDGQFRFGTTGVLSGIGGGAGGAAGLDGGASGGSPGGNDVGAPGCSGASLNGGATFISNVDGVANYTGDLSTLLSCMTILGDIGCGFENQLASIARALGADGSPAPSSNAGFLRPDAKLAIVVLSDEDDCSAPVDTDLYSLNGGQQNIANPLGPIANYRCNRFGHLCVDPAAAGAACLTEPPPQPPADVQVTASGPTLDLLDCESNDSSGKLTSISSFVKGIKALKADPDNQIVVGAIVAPPTPYTVAWVPQQGGQNTVPGELWPVVEHSCGPAGGDDVNPRSTQPSTDGTIGDPAVRIAQWVQAFGGNGITASICDGDYANAFGAIASKIGAHLPGGSGTDAGTVQAATASSALPICPNSVTSGSTSGLSNGGCACGVEPAHATFWTLALLGTFLAFARRRRASPR